MILVNRVVRDVCKLEGSVADRYDFVRRWADGGRSEDVPSVAAAILDRHAPVAARMNDFYWQLFDGDIVAAYVDPFAEVAR
jgi:hypothetical protein